MTDYDIHGKNQISGFAMRMKVKNAEKFTPEVQQLFEDLIKAIEYPKQSKIDDFEVRE